MTKKRSFLILIILACIGALIWLNNRVEPTVIPPEPVLPITGNIDQIIIEKSAHRMTVLQGGKTIREYQIALGFAPSGDKVKEGDGKTPEGSYKINRRNPNSAFTLSLGLNYPLPEDLERARAGGYSAGGDIFIHGQPNSLLDNLKLKGDWTAGCIALSNEEMRELWSVIPIGTEVVIRP